MLFYDVYTGEIGTEDSFTKRIMLKGWTPYYTLEGKYFGAKEEYFGYRVAQQRIKYIQSYWDF